MTFNAKNAEFHFFLRKKSYTELKLNVEYLSAPTTGIGVTKVANERHLPYLQLCGKFFFLISCFVGEKGDQSKVTITKRRPSSGQKLNFFTKHFVRAGNPRYFGEKNIISFSQN